MRHLVVIIFAFGSCYGQSNTKATDQRLNGHPISFYIAHENIPQVCKDLFNRVRQPAGDNDILSLFDSVFTNNKETAPFYFLTLTRTMPNADGAYAEAVGMLAKAFVEKKTMAFLDFFTKEPILTAQDFDGWARCVAGEVEIVAAGNDKIEFDKLKDKLKSNCAACNKKQLQQLDTFLKKVERLLPYSK